MYHSLCPLRSYSRGLLVYLSHLEWTAVREFQSFWLKRYHQSSTCMFFHYRQQWQFSVQALEQMHYYSTLWASESFISCCLLMSLLRNSVHFHDFGTFSLDDALLVTPSSWSFKILFNVSWFHERLCVCSRSINCHKVMAEAIERMLLLKYIDDTGSDHQSCCQIIYNQTQLTLKLSWKIS